MGTSWGAGAYDRTSAPRLPEDRRNAFAAAVVGRVTPPLDSMRLNVSARGRKR